MAQPVTIEAEFASSGVFVWGGSPVYVDLTSRSFSFSIQRGRNDYTEQFRAGTCTVVMRNDDAALDPDNSSSPYFGEIAPGRRLKITSNATSMLYAQILFTGFITDIQLDYQLGGGSTVTLQAVDGLGLLAQQQIAAGTSFSAELTSSRMTSVINLPEVDYPFLVGLGTGLSTCAATSTAEGNVLAYLGTIAETEQGAIFVNKAGTLDFRSRYDLLAASTHTFSDDGSDTDYEAIQRQVTALELYNRLQANRDGASPVVRDSSTSKGLFGVRFLDIGEVLFATDGEVTDMLDFALVRYASTAPRIAEVTTLLDSKSQIAVGQLCLLELTDSVTVEFTPPGAAQIVVQCSIESIRHDYTVGGGWRLGFGLIPRDTSNYLVLNDATLGQLDANVLGF